MLTFELVAISLPSLFKDDMMSFALYGHLSTLTSRDSDPIILGNHCVCSEEGLLSPTTSSLSRISTLALQVFPELELHIVPDAGHAAREAGTSKLLVEVCPHFSSLPS